MFRSWIYVLQTRVSIIGMPHNNLEQLWQSLRGNVGLTNVTCATPLLLFELTRIQLDWTPSRRTQKSNLPANQKGYDNSETTKRKLSARRIQISFDYFCKIHLWPLIFWNKWIWGPNKNSQSRFGFASPNTRLPRSQSLLRCLGSMIN